MSRSLQQIGTPKSVQLQIEYWNIDSKFHFLLDLRPEKEIETEDTPNSYGLLVIPRNIAGFAD